MLSLTDQAVAVDAAKLFVVGYPAMPRVLPSDDEGKRRMDVVQRLREIYDMKYGVRYLSPGLVMTSPDAVPDSPNGWVFTHDATSLGGNSGSCVLSFDHNLDVAGLHFAETGCGPTSPTRSMRSGPDLGVPAMSPPGDQAAVIPDPRELASRIACTRATSSVSTKRSGRRCQTRVPSSLSASGPRPIRWRSNAPSVRLRRRAGSPSSASGSSRMASSDQSKPRTDLQKVISLELGFPTRPWSRGRPACESAALQSRGRQGRQARRGDRHGLPRRTEHGADRLPRRRRPRGRAHPCAQSGSERQLRVRFDHATDRKEAAVYKVPDSWLVVWRPPHDDEIETTNGTPELVSPAKTSTCAGSSTSRSSSSPVRRGQSAATTPRGGSRAWSAARSTCSSTRWVFSSGSRTADSRVPRCAWQGAHRPHRER